MRCPKCQGLVVASYIEEEMVPKCLNCSMHFWPPNVMPLDHSAMRWESVICERCHDRRAMRGRETCITCRGHKVEVAA